MWRRKFALSLVLCVLLQPVSIFAGQINRTEEAFAATACNGVNFSYNLVILGTDAKITVGAIGGCGVEEIEAHVEMQKESAQGWTGYADWRYVKQGMRLSGEEHCLVEPGIYRLKITFYLRGDESGGSDDNWGRSRCGNGSWDGTGDGAGTGNRPTFFWRGSWGCPI